MFLVNGQKIDQFAWREYSLDGSDSTSSLVQTQPINATAEQLKRMGVTVIEDPVVAPVQPPLAQIISDRQFFQQLAIQGLITQDEALAAVGPGKLPASLLALVEQLPLGDGTPSDPNNQQFSAKMLLIGATQFDRRHPMVTVLGSAFKWNDEQLDTFWRAAGLLL